MYFQYILFSLSTILYLCFKFSDVSVYSFDRSACTGWISVRLLYFRLLFFRLRYVLDEAAVLVRAYQLVSLLQ